MTDLGKETCSILEGRMEAAEAARCAVKELCPNGMTSSAVAVAALVNLWKACMATIHAPAAHNRKVNSLHVANHICLLANTLIAIRELCASGLDLQARILLRSLLDAVYQAIILFHNQDDYVEFQRGLTEENSREVYYKLFTQKKGIFAKLAKIEEKLGVSHMVAQEFRKVREEAFVTFSQATHGSFGAVTFGSWVESKKSIEPTLLGCATTYSEAPLLFAVHEVVYFVTIFDLIADRLWNDQLLRCREEYSLMKQLASLAAQFRTYSPHSCVNESGCAIPGADFEETPSSDVL